MKKDVTLEAKLITRERFIEKISETVFCPEAYGLSDHKQCSTYICQQCWEQALRGIKFKGE